MRNGFLKNPKVIILLIVVVLAFIGYQQITKQNGSKNNKQILSTSTTPPKASVVVNRSFEFALPQQGTSKTVDKIKFTIVTAERKDEIKVKGQARKPTAGHDFLLLRLEIDNPTAKRINFISSDFIRLLGPSDKKYSPDFHNGTITLDPISVRRDLVSFMVDKDSKKFSFLVGELEKEKERVEIGFK